MISTTSTYRRFGYALLFFAAGPNVAWAGTCDVNPFAVVASIERIEPADGDVTIRRGDGSSQRAVLFECLLPGDTVVLQRRTSVVELLIAGEPRRIYANDSPFKIQGGYTEKVQSAMNLFAGIFLLRPGPTGAAVIRPRTKSARPLFVWNIPGLDAAQPVSLLDEQAEIVVGWRSNQAAAWSTRWSIDGSAMPSSSQSTETANGWFTTFRLLSAVGPGHQMRMSILDDNAVPVFQVDARVDDGATLPRPASFQGDWKDWSPEARVAWAAWALKEGPPQWRFQALTWFYRYRTDSWLAAHLFFRSVNGTF